jgi:hypothetical protein
MAQQRSARTKSASDREIALDTVERGVVAELTAINDFDGGITGDGVVQAGIDDEGHMLDRFGRQNI